MSFNINNSEVVKLTNKLEKLHRSAMPIAVRSTLNDSAFLSRRLIIKNFRSNTFGASSNTNVLDMYDCNFDYIDLRSVIFFNANNSRVNIKNCSMATGDVNHMLVDFYSLVSSEPGGGSYTGRVINIGGTNADPDGSSGGYDGLTAKTNLESKGFSVIIT